MINNLNKIISSEKDWSVKGITARRKRNQGRLKRLSQMEEKKLDINSIIGFILIFGIMIWYLYQKVLFIE